jgi:hypothetical protein
MLGSRNGRGRRRRPVVVVGALAAGLATAAVVAGPAQAAPVKPRIAHVDPDGSMLAVESTGNGRLDVFTVGALDNTLHHRSYADGTWSAWEDLGGNFTSAPAVISDAPGHLEVFARDVNNQLVHRWLVGPDTWSAWDNLGGELR